MTQDVDEIISRMLKLAKELGKETLEKQFETKVPLRYLMYYGVTDYKKYTTRSQAIGASLILEWILKQVKTSNFFEIAAFALTWPKEFSDEEKTNVWNSFILPQLKKLNLNMIEIGSGESGIFFAGSTHRPVLLSAFGKIYTVFDYTGESQVYLKNYKEASNKFQDGFYDVSYTKRVLDPGSGIGGFRKDPSEMHIACANLLTVFANLTKKGGISVHQGANVITKYTSNDFLKEIGFKLIKTVKSQEADCYVFEKISNKVTTEEEFKRLVRLK
jgi:hypothetical protein